VATPDDFNPTEWIAANNQTIPNSSITSSVRARALVRAIEALGTIEPSGPLERLLAGLLLPAYERRYLGRCTKVSSKDGPDEWVLGSRMTRNHAKDAKGSPSVRAFRVLS